MSARPATVALAPARRVAYAALRRVFEQGAYADRAFHGLAEDLPARDRALSMRLTFGAVQRRATLDHVMGELVARPIARLQPPVRAALRLGLYELLYLSGAPARAVVADAVELAKHAGVGPGGAGLVNAVLRRAAREGGALLAALGDESPQRAAVLHSVPLWLAEMWWAQLGPEVARAQLAAVNRPAESALRANALVIDTDELAQRLPVAAHRDPLLSEALVLEDAFDAHGSPLWHDGAFMPQSRAAMLPAHVLAPRPGEHVLDLCAAPGGKTTQLAALMEDRGEVVAVERHPGRARALVETARRMRAASVRVVVADATEPAPPASSADGAYDAVLVDPPCSGLGTLDARPDLRWRVDPTATAALAREQVAMLAAGAQALRPGGRLVYSTCTISAAENEFVISALLEHRSDFVVEDLGARWPAYRHPNDPHHLLTLPDRDATAGFFVAGLRRVR